MDLPEVISPEVISETARTARSRLGDLIDRALRGETTVITRHGKEVAAVVPAGALRRLRLLEDEADRRAVLDALHERTHGLDEVLRETLERTR